MPLRSELPNVVVGQRFTVVSLERLPPVQLIRKLRTTWQVAEIRPDGPVDRAHFRLSKDGLVGKRVQVLAADFRPEGEAMNLVPAKPGAPALAKERLLTAEEFHRLKDVPPEAEWFANISNPQNPASLPKRRDKFHGVRRDPATGGVSDGVPSPCSRLARGVEAGL